ncbi:MAG: type II toxin-antitoxin system HicA family toxin, partial [Terriglobales bacterium]
MKRSSLLRHLRRFGCVLRREGSAHSLWVNPNNGATSAVPRHVEIADRLARRICQQLEQKQPCCSSARRAACGF